MRASTPLMTDCCQAAKKKKTTPSQDPLGRRTEHRMASDVESYRGVS